MIAQLRFLNRIFAAGLFFGLIALPAGAGPDSLDGLFELLQEPELPNWKSVEDEIWAEWSRSGSPSMDLLLQRGRDAMAAEDYATAIGHFTALTDHAPDFAEGYNARATAYFRQGLYGPALADINRVLALNPRHFGAMAGLGTIMDELGHPEAALRAFHAAAAVHPHEPDLLEAVERLEMTVSGTAL
ncbi:MULTISPECIES: tetratricopeptide repeat protein [Actibacterium]|uniref:Tetratricopeptide (TPR) repeat protein n=1 Tax=Actibacterium naphthalenivorans TaxID=1614693 RepID=A0A840CDE6_9RHOB|nr:MULTISPECIES: tetratricopeptide repeat protein [Actibacterium]ALG90977.1 hypothetical protein TQ29_13290 [Actibacterium sp. EMB200-NS6]MBB4023355.1 tetratricopeptide (TPR) repeat protein [Actibacterium naphthalenivorans]